MLARVLTARREPPESLVDLWQPALVVGVPWLLIMAQPDLGSGLAFIGILFAMLFWAGVPWPMLVLLASPAVSLILSFSAGIWGRGSSPSSRSCSTTSPTSPKGSRSSSRT
jgi:rod shape determining protein RodA